MCVHFVGRVGEMISAVESQHGRVNMADSPQRMSSPVPLPLPLPEPEPQPVQKQTGTSLEGFFGREELPAAAPASKVGTPAADCLSDFFS
jgi:hypothetical protein